MGDGAPLPPLLAIFAAVVPELADSASPQCVCWGFLLVDRLPHWLKDPELQPQVAKLIDAVVPHVAAAWRLLPWWRMLRWPPQSPRRSAASYVVLAPMLCACRLCPPGRPSAPLVRRCRCC